MSALAFNQALEKLVAQRLKEKINELGQKVGAGQMSNFEQYKYHCGIIKGLQEAGEIIENALLDIQKAGRGDSASG